MKNLVTDDYPFRRLPHYRPIDFQRHAQQGYRIYVVNAYRYSAHPVPDPSGQFP
jgi:hypothetical protein